MFENLKSRVVIVLGILLVLFFFSTLSSCNSAMRQKTARDKEMAARLVLEEKVNKFSQDRAVLEEKAKAKEKEVSELKITLENVNKSLIQEQMVNQSLKDELQKVAKLKETLENDSKSKDDGKKFKK
ncbi:MAG: hypothetical protein WCY09_02770 [Candidatus Omnitrophota bacterium]